MVEQKIWKALTTEECYGYREAGELMEEIRKAPQDISSDSIALLECAQLTDAGYYWWLPSCAKDRPDLDENWSVISWHPKNEFRQKSGLFVGPLKSPARAF